MSLDPSSNTCRNKLNAGQQVMLTLAPSDARQYAKVKVIHRLNKFRQDEKDIVTPILKCIFTEYAMSIELSEVLASEGSKYPRLHYHVVGKVKCPIEFLLNMAELTSKYQIGYHITIIKPEKEEYYERYIRKQTKQWRGSRYVIKTFQKEKVKESEALQCRRGSNGIDLFRVT